MHVPTLPSKPSWETPISASREIVEAITDAADSAVDAATTAVRSARRRRGRGTSLPRPSWRWVAAAVVVVGAVAVIRRRRSGSGPGNGSVDPAGVGRSEAARTDGRVQEYGDDILAGADRAHSTVAD